MSATGAINYTLLFERVIVQLELVSEAPAASVGNESSHSKPGSKVLFDPGFVVPRLRHHFSACQNDSARRRVVEEALGELRHARYAADHSMRKGTVEWKQAIANDPRPSRVVAEIRGIDHRTVLQYRKRATD